MREFKFFSRIFLALARRCKFTLMREWKMMFCDPYAYVHKHIHTYKYVLHQIEITLFYCIIVVY